MFSHLSAFILVVACGLLGLGTGCTANNGQDRFWTYHFRGDILNMKGKEEVHSLPFTGSDLTVLIDDTDKLAIGLYESTTDTSLILELVGESPLKQDTSIEYESESGTLSAWLVNAQAQPYTSNCHDEWKTFAHKKDTLPARIVYGNVQVQTKDGKIHILEIDLKSSDMPPATLRGRFKGFWRNKGLPWWWI